MKGKKVKREELQPGMKIFQPVYVRGNELLAAKGSIVTEGLLVWFQLYQIPYVYIEDTIAGQVLDGEEISYSQKIKNSKEFKEFQHKYDQALECYTSSLNAIVEHIAVEDNVREMMKRVTALLVNKQGGRLHVFNMLQNMRDLDDSTYVHALNVAMIANIMGSWYGLSEEDLEVLTMSGLLHDIGKLMVPKEILQKPGKLTQEEYDTIKNHCMRGYELISGIGLDERIEMAVAMHHERCDGSGYPKGLMGKQIHDFAKIIAIADVYDAMTAARVYRGPICPFHVADIMAKEGARCYDLRFLNSFLKNVVQSYLGNTVLLSNGMRGEVIMINERTLASPMIRCGEEFFDLSKDKEIKIEAIL